MYGFVGEIIDKLAESDITEQTKQTLAKIEGLLAEAGTSRWSLSEFVRYPDRLPGLLSLASRDALWGGGVSWEEMTKPSAPLNRDMGADGNPLKK